MSALTNGKSRPKRVRLYSSFFAPHHEIFDLGNAAVLPENRNPVKPSVYHCAPSLVGPECTSAIPVWAYRSHTGYFR